MFRLLLLRRPLCRCGRQLDSFGHHLAAVELADGVRVTANVMDLATPQQALDGIRLEVVADGLPLCPVRADSSTWCGPT